MAIQKGLSPFDQRRAASGGNQGRAQTPDPGSIKTPGLRPAASPVDTYVRPEEADRDPSGLLRLAQSLGQLQPSILGFAGALTQEARKPETLRGNAEVYLAERGLTGAREDIAAGKATPLSNLHGAEVYGKARAEEARTAFNEAITNGSLRPEDAETWWQERMAGDLEGMPKDDSYRRAYATQANQHRERSRASTREYIGKMALDQKTQDLYTTWAGGFQDALDGNKDLKGAATDLFKQFDTNRNLLGIDYKTQTKMAVQLAEQLATQGKGEAARAILSHAREDGPAKGQTLLTNLDTADRANNILLRIDNAERKAQLARVSVASEDDLNRRTLETVFTGSPLPEEDAYTGPDGDRKAVSRTQLEQRRSTAYIEHSNRVARERGENPQQQFLWEVEEVSRGTGMERKDWTSTMEAGVPTVNKLTLEQKEMPPEARKGYELYRQLRAVNPNYVDKFISDKAQTFYEQVVMAQEAGASDLNNAYRQALLANSPESVERLKEERGVGKVLDQKTDAAIQKLQKQDPTRGMFTGSNVTNTAAVSKRVRDLAEHFVRVTGGDPEAAIERAAQRVLETSVVYRGNVMKRRKDMPDNIESLFEEHLDEFVSKHGEKLGGVDKDDLSIMADPDAAGVYYVYNPTTFEIYAELPEGNINARDFRALAERHEAKTQAERERVAAEQAKHQEARTPNENGLTPAQERLANGGQGLRFLGRGGAPDPTFRDRFEPDPRFSNNGGITIMRPRGP